MKGKTRNMRIRDFIKEEIEDRELVDSRDCVGRIRMGGMFTFNLGTTMEYSQPLRHVCDDFYLCNAVSAYR